MLDRVGHNLERYLDTLAARQRVVASNIANADTPGYKTKDLDFAAELQRASGLSPVASEVAGLQVKNDGNNVSLDREARLLGENALRFNVTTNLLRSQLRMVRAAIQEGRAA
jgi:flagellar basal-body rod protein FlgB